MRPPRAVAEAPALTRALLDAKHPALVRGAALDWPAMKWTLPRLAELGDEVTVYRIADGELVFDRRGLVETRLPLGRALEALDRFRVRASVPRQLPSLASDVPVFEACRGRLRLEPTLWVSGPGVRSRVHYDQPENLLVQLHGTKRVRLLSPRDGRRLDRYEGDVGYRQFSAVDVMCDAPPVTLDVLPHDCTIGPGDALFIPGGWWHALESEEFTLMVGVRWWRPSRVPLLLAADLYKRARGWTR